jgi:hypothetical protein
VLRDEATGRRRRRRGRGRARSFVMARRGEPTGASLLGNVERFTLS